MTKLCRVSIDENNYQSKLQEMPTTNYQKQVEAIIEKGLVPCPELAGKAHREWLASLSKAELDEFFGGY